MNDPSTLKAPARFAHGSLPAAVRKTNFPAELGAVVADASGDDLRAVRLTANPAARQTIPAIRFAGQAIGSAQILIGYDDVSFPTGRETALAIASRDTVGISRAIFLFNPTLVLAIVIQTANCQIAAGPVVIDRPTAHQAAAVQAVDVRDLRGIYRTADCKSHDHQDLPVHRRPPVWLDRSYSRERPKPKQKSAQECHFDAIPPFNGT